MILIMAAGAVCAGAFYWYYLRGIGPVIKQPPRDISEMINEGRKSVSENKTDMPLKSE